MCKLLSAALATLICIPQTVWAEPKSSTLYPKAQLTEVNTPILVTKCTMPGTPQKRCREARIGLRDGKIVSEGDLPLDEAFAFLVEPSGPLSIAECDRLLTVNPPKLPEECRR